TLQLYGTLTTHYYLNLDIPHLEEFRSQYKAQQEVNPPLAISKERCHDLSQEKLRNRFPLSTLMQQNPDTYIVSDVTIRTPVTTETGFLLKGTPDTSIKEIGSEFPGNKTHDEPTTEGIPSKRTSKRPLFQDDPNEQKKKK
ncbi:hypothetical protein Tco_1137607, partial [Tanacetum coccineum]